MLLHRFVITSTLVAVLLFTGCQVATGQCSNRAYLYSTQNVGTFYSPGYPSSYSSNKDCSWLITAPSNQRVLLYFTSFQLENEGSCDYDSVAVYDGQNSLYSSRLAKKCGSEIPSPIYSSGRYLLVTFRSDSSVTSRGFKAEFSSLTNSSDCPRIFSGDSTGVIYSPGFPWSYPNNKECSWYIRAPYGRVNLTFTTFKMDPLFCSDYVEVKNGYGTLISKRCRQYSFPFTILSTGNTLRVRFSSNSFGSYKGFLAFYQQTGVFPTTPYWFPTTRSSPASYACQAYSRKLIIVKSSTSIASPYYPYSASRKYYTTSHWSSNPTCSWQVVTKDKDYLELTFDDDMSISSCYSGCSCGKLEVREGDQDGQHIGTFCLGETFKVSSKDDFMFVAFYASDGLDKFKATIRAKNKGVSVAEIVVPVVVGLVLFGIIFAVIKCTKKVPSTGQPGTLNAGEVPMQSFTPPCETVETQQDFVQYPQGEAVCHQYSSDGTETV